MESRKNTEVAQEDRYLSLSAAALALGASRNGVLGHIARRELETEVVAGRPVVTRASVEKLKAQKSEEAKQKEEAELASRRRGGTRASR